MALLGINEARNSLSVASNNYAKIQRELDKYNKLFQTYAMASPETQIRAASVMRQALNEYNSLKAQQEDNAIKIYEAQNWVNYYNNTPAEVQTTPTVNQAKVVSPELMNNLPSVNIDSGTYEEEPVIQETPVLNTATPGSSDIVNVATTQSANNEATLNPKIQAATERARATLGGGNKVRNYTSTFKPTTTSAPVYPNTTIKPATTQWARNININRSGAGNVAGISSGSALTGLRYR